MSLNDKRQEVEPDDYVYPEEDVKEFIKKLKEGIKTKANYEGCEFCDWHCFEIIDKKAGEGLI